MSDTFKISGTWQGELTYGEEFPEEIKNKKKSFRMELKEIDGEENDGEFSGTYYETEGFGIIPEPAGISGFIEDDIISIVKQFSALYLVNERGEVKSIPDKIPPEVNYSGFYNEETQSFEGDWSMVIEFKQLAFGYAENAVSGTWTMKKVQ